MLHPNYLLLYVADPLKSAEFYTGILGIEPVERSPAFVLYVFPGGHKLGLWLRDDVSPRPQAAAGAAEWCTSVAGRDEVLGLLAAWKARGVTILQEPTAMDFGFTFTAADPDGHRLRVFAPNPE